MKVLIITHSGDLVYGAAKSLKMLLGCTKFDYEIVYDKVIKKTYSDKELADYAGSRCQKIHFYNLPVYYDIMDDYQTVIKRSSLYGRAILLLKRMKKQFLYNLHKRSLKKLIKNEGYDYVYLNTSVLYELLSSSNKMIIHIRELLRESLPCRIENKIIKAYKYICIDTAVKMHLINSSSKIDETKVNVLINPFDMGSVFKIDKTKTLEKYNIDSGKLVFLIAGVINEEKGVDFVFKVFEKEKWKDKVLLVAGRQSIISDMIVLKKLDNVKYIGQIKNMDEIYSITDCIVRGEKEFCTGRTVFEALYAGCQALLPGHKDSLHNANDFENDQIDRVFLYEPRDSASLVDAISKIKKIDKSHFKTDNMFDFSSKLNNIFS